MQSQDAHEHHGMNYYQILGLIQETKSDSRAWSHEDLKNAYHRALLLHHPDKAQKHNSGASPRDQTQANKHRHSIDEIMIAYETLTNPKLKRDYDAHLLRSVTRPGGSAVELSQRGSHLGVETYDLDDLDYDEAQEQWTKSCRCGDIKGYTVTEDDLERTSRDGEVYVGCHGCSLFIKILFGVTTQESDTIEVQDQFNSHSV